MLWLWSSFSASLTILTLCISQRAPSTPPPPDTPNTYRDSQTASLTVNHTGNKHKSKNKRSPLRLSAPSLSLSLPVCLLPNVRPTTLFIPSWEQRMWNAACLHTITCIIPPHVYPHTTMWAHTYCISNRERERARDRANREFRYYFRATNMFDLHPLLL